METRKLVQPKVDETVKWLKAHPRIQKQSIRALKLGDRCLCDVIALRPQTLLALAAGTYEAAVAARAPKEVLLTLKTRRDMVKSGLERLPRFAYSWLSVSQMGDVKSKAKVGSLLAKAALRAPDRSNKKLLTELSQSLTARPGGGGGGAASLPCWLCCALGCLECGPFCVVCCVFGCLICTFW